MRALWLNLTDTIAEPTQAFRRLRTEPMVLWALIVSMVTSIDGVFRPAEIIPVGAVDFSIPGWSGMALSIPFLLLWTLTVLIMGRAFGGSGTYASLLSGLGFAQLPGIFAAPILLLSASIGSWFGGLAGFALSVWQLVLHVLAVRETLQLSTGKTIGAMLLSGLVLVVGISVLAVIFVFLFAGALGVALS